MNSTWSPSTPCEMVCPDCGRTLPRRTIRHHCTDRFRQPIAANVLEVYEQGRFVSRTIAQNPLEVWNRRQELGRSSASK